MRRQLCPNCLGSFDEYDLVRIGDQELCPTCAGVPAETAEEAPAASPPQPVGRMASVLAATPTAVGASAGGVAAAVPARASTQVRMTSGSEYLGRLAECFTYPLEGSGIAMVIVGGIYFGGMQFMGGAGGLFSWIFGLLGTGYLCAYLQKIINTTAMGHEKLPRWPSFTNMFDSLLTPLRLFVFPVLICMVPAILYAFIFRGWTFFISPMFYFLIFLGLCYAPMAVLAVSMFGGLSAMNPNLVIPSILRIFSSYVVLLIVYVVLGLISGAVESIALVLPLIGFLASSIVHLYFLIVQMRFLGFLYYDHQAELRWV